MKRENFFGVEDRILDQLALHNGSDAPLLTKARREHKELRQLLKKGDLKSLKQFAEKLIQHIYFEEDKLFPVIESEFTPEEQEWVETDIQFNIHDWPKIPAFSDR